MAKTMLTKKKKNSNNDIITKSFNDHKSWRGIFKPRALVVQEEPCSPNEALTISEWRDVMGKEYEALQRNRTWALAPLH